MVLVNSSLGSINGYLCPYSRKKFLGLVQKPLSSAGEDVANIYFAVNTYKNLNEPVPQDSKKTACEALKRLFKPDLEIDNVYYALGAQKLLSCDGKLLSEGVAKVLYIFLFYISSYTMKFM